MIDVAIVGASGYAARELFRILADHPDARVTAATSRQDEGTRVDALHPSLTRKISLTCEPFDPDRIAEVGLRSHSSVFRTRRASRSRPFTARTRASEGDRSER